MTADRLTRMLSDQLALQRRLGIDYSMMRGDPATRRDYVLEMVTALSGEIHEALGEVAWKSWAATDHFDPDRFLGELRDAWQFLTNLMLIVEDDPARLAQRLELALASKLSVNLSRIEQNYDGRSSKCPACHRALDDVGISQRDVGAGMFALVCGACRADIATESIIQ